MNTILIPFYERPELLYLTLESVARNPEASAYRLELATHDGFDPLCMEVINGFLGCFSNMQLHVDPRHGQAMGLTRNILENIKRLAPDVDEYLLLIEEDIRIAPDCLRFLDASYREFHGPNVFAHLAFVRESEESSAADAASLVERRQWYHPWGVLLPTDTLELILPHCSEAYYSNRGLYVEKLYPSARLGLPAMGASNEQAGMLQRLRAKHRPDCIWPKRSRAQHMGYWGGPPGRYQPCPHEGTFDERVRAVREVMADHWDYVDRRWRSWNDYAPHREDNEWETLRLS